MQEREKLEEAKYFLARIRAATDPKQFQYELSAFLSSARTVMQYAYEESKPKSGGNAWYSAQVSSHPAVRFFKDKRDLNIHVRPVRPASSVGIHLKDKLRLTSSLNLQVRSSKGEILEERSVNDQLSAEEPKPELLLVSYTYSFPDWPGGNNDVVYLCHSYLAELEDIVDNGVLNGMISG